MAHVRKSIHRLLLPILVATSLPAGAALLEACQTAQPQASLDEAEQASAQTAAASAAITLEQRSATARDLLPGDFTIEATVDEFLVGIDDLAQARGQARLLDTGRKVYIMNGKSYRSAVFMRKGASGWAVSQVHGSDLGDALASTLSTLRAKVHADDDAFFLVDVHGLHLMLIGHRENGALFLTPPSDRPDLNLTANTVSPASELLSRLAVEAQLWTTETAKMLPRR